MPDLNMQQCAAALAPAEVATRSGPGERTLRSGAKELPDHYHVSIANRPYAVALADLFQRQGQAVPPSVGAMDGKAYLVTHALGIIADERASGIERIGFHTTFAEGGTIVDRVPGSLSKEHGGLAVDGTLETGLGIDGQAAAALPAVDLGADAVQLGLGAEVRLGASSNVVGNLSLRMAFSTPLIQATGQASNAARWQVRRDTADLVGNQAFVQTVVVDNDVQQLSFEVGGYVVFDPGFFSRTARYELAPIAVTVDL